MIRPILKGPDPRLLEVCTRFYPAHDEQVITDLSETFHDLGNARGLAAPQIGHMKRAFIMRMASGEIIIATNPEIIRESGPAQEQIERCLSFPWLNNVQVERMTTGTMRYWDGNGHPSEARLVGMDWRVACHEMDHLDGITLNKRKHK